jgi:ferritin
MPGHAVNPTVLVELQRQLNHELSAAYAYDGLALWCEDQDFKGFARFFLKQAAEERAHARRFMDHLLDRGVLPELAPVPAPKMQFRSLMDVARQAQGMERANTAGIHAAYEAALGAKDYPAQVLLHWFVNEQVEEEDWAAEMVNRVERANCAGGVAELDRHIERYLTEKVAEAGDES